MPHPLDAALSFQDLKMFLIKVGFGLLVLCYALVGKLELIGAMAGYVLFTGNIYLLAYVAKLVFVLVSENSGRANSKKGKGFLGLLVFCKFSFLASALFGLIVVFKIPGLPLFMGSLVSLFSVSGYLALRYLEYLTKVKKEKNSQTSSAGSKSAVQESRPSYDILLKTTIRDS